MSTLSNVFHAEFLLADWSARIGLTLIHSVWQIALIAFAFVLASYFLRKRTPQIRYVLGCFALGAMVGLPASTYLLLRINVATATADAGQPSANSPSHDFTWPDAKTVSRSPFPATRATDELPSRGHAKGAKHPASVQSLRWATQIWFLGVFVFSLRPLCGSMHAWRLGRSGLTQLSESLQGMADRLVQRLGVNRCVRFAESKLILVPTVVGFWRPLVLLPLSLASNLSAAEIELILAHELAHVRRHDYVVNLLQTVVEALLFYHPGMWWLSSQIRRERENCCDDVAVAFGGSSVIYARALCHLEEQRLFRPASVVSASGASLLVRIRRLLGRPSDGFGHRWVSAWLTGFAALGIFAGSTAMSGMSDNEEVLPPIERASADALDTPLSEAVDSKENQKSPHREFVGQWEERGGIRQSFHSFEAGGHYIQEITAPGEKSKRGTWRIVGNILICKIGGVESRVRFEWIHSNAFRIHITDNRSRVYQRLGGELSIDRLLQAAGVQLDNGRTNYAELSDLFVEVPLGSGSYEMRSEIVFFPGELERIPRLDLSHGAVFYVPGKNVCYVQHNPIGSSSMTYYGPFPGNPEKIVTRSLLGQWESAEVTTPWGTGRLVIEITGGGTLTLRLFESESKKPIDSHKGIWSRRGNSRYAFAFEADHPNAPGVGVIELKSAEIEMTVTTSHGPTTMTIRLRRPKE